MLNRETLIARIEQELVQAEQAQHDHDFEKHGADPKVAPI